MQKYIFFILFFLVFQSVHTVFDPLSFLNKSKTKEPFNFDQSSQRRKPVFSQVKEMEDLIGRLCTICKERDTHIVPNALFIDAAREIVNSDDEYKAEASFVKYILFRYPSLGYTAVAVASFGLGAITHFAFS